MALSKIAAEKLENELLLSKGGGIYYDAARVTADETTATLFVGLGGTGADMLIRIKNEVKRRMVLPQINGKISGDTPNNIGFIAFDTDQTTSDKTWGIASFDKYGKEFCSLGVDDIPKVVENRCKLVDRGDPVWQWYEKIPADMAVRGANGRRQIGRLLLFENIKKVYDKIQSSVRELVKTGDGINTVNVMLVTGIAGGTGSGTFIDMAYIIREALEGLKVRNKQVFGFIVLPDVNLLNGGQKDRLLANAFASLKELDYWMCAEEGEQNAIFEQNYGQNISIKTQRTIFNFCHLLSAQDYAGYPLSYDKVINSMAEFVFAYIAGETGQQSSGNTAMESMYDNINGYVETLAGKVAIPACYRYLAIGTHKLEIPYEEISTLLAVRLFERLEPIFALRPTEETFKADMKILRLIPKSLIHDSLTEDVPPSPIDGNHKYQYPQIWGGDNTSYNQNSVYYDVNQWYAREFQTAVTKNSSNFVQVKNDFFLTFIKDNMKKEDRGPLYLSALLKSDNKWSIIPTLEGVAQFCDDVAATCETKRSMLEEELRREYNAGHGKILNKSRSVNSYISALGNWMENRAGAYVYAERAHYLRLLRDKLLLYYENIFSKLTDVIEALPTIFRQNLDRIKIAQEDATKAGQLDDTKLIWPLKFEEENRTEFEKMLKGACASFLENLTNDLAKWTGYDLYSLEANSGGNTDVPGFISGFIGEQFGKLLSINMEDVISSKLGGGEGLDDYLHSNLLRIKDRSIPMFNVDAAHSNLELNEFAIASVPEDCVKIEAAAKNYYTDSGITKKVSREKTRLYYVKVVSGIPLFAYSNIKECAKYYKFVMSIEKSRIGTHLNPAWADCFPTPYPENAWPLDYNDEAIKEYNERIGTAFDKCLAAGVIYMEQDGPVTKKCLLKTADTEKAKLLDIHLTGSIDGRLAQLKEIEEELWRGEKVVLPQMGNPDSFSLEKLTRDSVLRIPRLCALIMQQLNVIEKCKEKKREIEDPKFFAYALLCGLITKQGFELVLKRSADSVLFDMLYDTTQEKSFEEYEAYLVFRKLIDDIRRGEIEIFRTELLRRIGNGSPEKVEMLERAETVIKQYSASLPEAQTRIDRANIDKRKGYQDTLDFYTSVVTIATNHKDKYLS